MKNATKPLLFTLFTTSLFFNFIGCQKQNVENTQQQTSTSPTNIARVIDHDYSIALKTAAQFTKTYREIKGKDEPIAYMVPIDGLRQLINRVDANGMANDVTHVKFYIGVRPDGRRTAIYVATMRDGADVLRYSKEEQTNNFDATTSPVYDETSDCPGSCISTTNVLNGN